MQTDPVHMAGNMSRVDINLEKTESLILDNFQTFGSRCTERTWQLLTEIEHTIWKRHLIPPQKGKLR